MARPPARKGKKEGEGSRQIRPDCRSRSDLEPHRPSKEKKRGKGKKIAAQSSVRESTCRHTPCSPCRHADRRRKGRKKRRGVADAHSVGVSSPSRITFPPNRRKGGGGEENGDKMTGCCNHGPPARSRGTRSFLSLTEKRKKKKKKEGGRSDAHTVPRSISWAGSAPSKSSRYSIEDRIRKKKKRKKKKGGRKKEGSGLHQMVVSFSFPSRLKIL